jgi:CheY-like chemotaxis protein
MSTNDHDMQDERSSRYSLGLTERVVARTTDTTAMMAGVNDPEVEKLDWVLTNYDKKASEPQSLEEELKRLQALRSYLILDSEREHQFERLTALASRVMQVPIALVSLVDLGRQWFMSNRGLGDVRETPRSQAFCSHAILSKEEILIINDAQLDPRFANNPLVTGPPYIRFYAGAPLETPEGYKLGTFCIIDTKPWPNGLDLDSKQNLREMAALAVEVMVARRQKWERDQEKSSQLVACTAHDLLTPLSGIELSLHLLKEDEDFQQKLTQKHKHGMKNVEACSDIIQEICTSVRQTYAEAKSSFEQSLMQAHLERVNVNRLVERLYTVMEPVQKDVPIRIIVDDNVPKEIISDSSKIFRGAINYLVVACQRTRKGMISMRFFIRKDSDDGKKALLLVTCEDTAPPVKLDMYDHLFKLSSKDVTLFQDELGEKSSLSHGQSPVSPELCLISVACEMNIVGGDYGFRPRSEQDKGCERYDKEIGAVSGSVFWFCIPCTGLEQVSETKPTDVYQNSDNAAMITHDDAAKFHDSVAGNFRVERQKRALVIEDSTVVRKMLTKILTKLDFDVSQAENGMEGLEKLKSTLFDLTLCDFLMPIMDGLDCVQQYRDWEKYHRPWISQRIVGMSAHATLGDIEKGMKVGMDDYKNKPVTFKVLSELINCDKQDEISNQLDEIERREGLARSAESTESKNGKENVSQINGRPCTCLVIAPKSEEEHIKLMQGLIKSLGWQSTTASTENEVLTWLKMRMWDLVLVDDAFAPSIATFREWEAKRRKTPQTRVTLMTETVDAAMVRHTQPPGGIDALAVKPLGLAALDKLIHRTFFDLNSEEIKRKANKS